MSKIIELKGLNGGYSDNEVLKNINLSINNGSMTAITGQNGCGKTTILKYLIKELKTNDNSIYINGKDINRYSQKELAKVISYVPQLSKPQYEFKVKEFVSLGRYAYNDISENNEIVEKSLESAGILYLKDKLITEISGGELQLTVMARAISQESEILILDEPTNNLDPEHQLKLMDILAKLYTQNKTIICVMHDLNMVLRYFENIIMIKSGTIYSEGKTIKTLTEKSIYDVFNTKAKIIPARDRLPSTIYYNL